MNRLHRQLFGGLDRHEAHVWSVDLLADGFGIIPIVLVGLRVRRDKLGTDQPNIVTKLRNRLRPKVRPVRSLHADETRWQVCEEWQNSMTTKRLAQHRPSMSVDAMNLEDIFRQIQTNASDLRDTSPSMRLTADRNLSRPGGVHTIAAH
jgi:hypothetical protein